MKRQVFWAFLVALLFAIAPQQARAACDLDVGGSPPFTMTTFEAQIDEELACLEIGVFVQAYDADLDTWAGTTPASGVATALATPSSANLRSAFTDEVGTGALMFGLAAGMADDLSCTASQVVRRNAGDTAFECATFAGGGDALVANSLAQFAATTSLELAGVISNETGSGALMFGTDPAITGSITIPNTGLHLLDSNASHDLIIAPGSDLTADHTLTVTTGDADRTLDISGASVTISAYIAGILDDANEATLKASINAEAGVDFQAFDSDLSTWAGLTPSANAQSLVTAANYAAMRGLLDLEAGTDFYSIAAADAAFQPIDADLTLLAAGTFTDPNLDQIVWWDDSQGRFEFMSIADMATEAAPATGDYITLYGAEGDVRKVDWSSLPGAGGGISNIVEDATPQLGGALDTNGNAIEFGTAATDTSVVRSGAGDLTIEGNVVYRAGGTDVALADGGTGASLADPNADRLMFWDDSVASTAYLTLGTAYATSTTTLRSPTESFCVAASDETTAITTGTAKVTFRMPYAFTLTNIRGSLNTVSSSGSPLIDINEAGTSVATTNKLLIDVSEKTSVTAGTAIALTDTSLADDAEMTIDIDTAGTGAKGLKVCLIGYQT